MSNLLRKLSSRITITGKNRDVSQPDLNDEVRKCPLCSCLKRVELYYRDRRINCLISETSKRSAMVGFRRSLFHQQCDQCDDTSDILLCKFCNHLRLRHLISNWMAQGGTVYLNFGRARDVRQRSRNCGLCNMITQEACLRECNPNSDCTARVSFGPTHKEIQFSMEVHINDLGEEIIREFEGVFASAQVDTSTRRKIWQQRMVDWSKVRTWLRKCDEEHGKKHECPCDNGYLRSPPPEFRVIDIKKGCIVMAPPACRYATLSYVWGKSTDTDALATTSTIQALEEEGYLFKIPLPATIRDSIRACIGLKIWYLWIDRLCIVQDDTTTVKDSQINAMGDIYSHSYLTLVDLEGAGMDHGLPGVSQARAGRKIYETDGMSMRVIHSNLFRMLVMNSKWGTRGWTFQEAMLSPRMLLFAEAGVLFECSQASQEEIFARSTSTDLLFTPTNTYGILVHDFTSRNLTFDADILKAFSGIMHWKYGSEHYFGLPYRDFVKGMLWYPCEPSLHKAPRVRNEEPSDIFPTWSWSSVMGRVRLSLDTVTDTLLGVWGIPSFETGGLVHIIRPRPAPSILDLLWRERPNLLRGLGIAMVLEEGCFQELSPPILYISTTRKDYEALIMSAYASTRLKEEALKVASARSKKDLERLFSPSYMKNAYQPGALLAHTQSLRAQMVHCGGPVSQTQTGIRYVHATLHSMRDDKVDMWIQSNPAHWHFLDHDYSKDSDVRLDVLALSMSHFYEDLFVYRHQRVQGQWYDSEGHVLRYGSDYVAFWVDVLIVETRDGLSRRVTIGQVELHDWVTTSHELRSFILV